MRVKVSRLNALQMCIAPFVAMLLRNPEEIVRTDGKAVMDFPKESFGR